MLDMTLMPLPVAVAPRTGKIIRNKRGENLQQNGILRFVFKLSQSSEIVFQS